MYPHIPPYSLNNKGVDGFSKTWNMVFMPMVEEAQQSYVVYEYQFGFKLFMNTIVTKLYFSLFCHRFLYSK